MTQAKLDVAKAGAATSYMSGFANEFATEALPEALPVGRNSPQRVAYGLYAEQISGSAFTAPRAHNRRSWLYRTRPAPMHKPFVRIEQTTNTVGKPFRRGAALAEPAALEPAAHARAPLKCGLAEVQALVKLCRT